jgi:hypothetical protein
MKKWIATILAVAMVLSLCACGGDVQSSQDVVSASASEAETVVSVAETEEPAVSEEPEEISAEETAEEPPVDEAWIVQQTVDEFGDVTEDSESVLATEIQGDFSNTATASSELDVVVRFSERPNSEHYLAQFVLFEYNDTPATYLSSDSITLKTKVDDTITEYSLYGEAPNGSLFLGYSDYDYGADILFNELYSGKDVRCIINIGDSQYNFTIESANIVTVCDNLDFDEAPGEMTANEAVKIYLSDENETLATSYFETHRDEFEILDTNQLTDTLSGDFFEITCKSQYWTIHRFADGTRSQIVFFEESYGIRTYRDTEYTYPDSFENDVLTVWGYAGGVIEDLQIREVSDGIYIAYEPDDAGDYTVPNRLMVKCENEVHSMIDLYDEIERVNAAL